MPPHSSPPSLRASRILIVDDEPRNISLLTRALEVEGFSAIASTSDSSRAATLFRDLAADLVILDLHMPTPDGFEVMRQLRDLTSAGCYVPILVVTANVSEAVKRRALSAGARDFLTKPFSLTEAILRIRNLLETRALYLELESHNRELADRVAERTRELEAARLDVLERLSQAVEFRDDVTGRHTRRVGELAAALATAFGVPEPEVDLVRRAAPLHDVGKIAIPDCILQKPGRLSPAELEVMRRHTTFGGEMLSGGRTGLMLTAEVIARSHHEQWSGGGYPAGLREEEIPLSARIVAVADVFDAVTNPRQYRDAWSKGRALEEIRSGAGKHFDPLLAEAFLDLQPASGETIGVAGE